jgi:peptidoglycan/xylan/chitin deacetylase (PgdA/CDA1 family)
MKPTRSLKNAAKVVLHDLGGIHGFRRVYANGIRILMYHRFTHETEALKRQCEVIQRYYNPVSLRSVSEYIRNGVPLPKSAVAITVDDGYRDFLIHGFPVFQEFNLAPTVFVVTDFLDGKCWQWWDTIRYTLWHTKRKLLAVEFTKGESFRASLDTAEERERARRGLAERLKLVENAERLRVCQVLPELLEVDLPKRPTEQFAPLEWNEVRELSADGVEFGAHTKTHPILSRVGDPEQLRQEIEGSKQRLEEELGSPTIHFCYPNGRRVDIDQETLKLVREGGFHIAVTTERGMNFGQPDPFLLRRLAVDPADDPRYFQELLSGVRKE